MKFWSSSNERKTRLPNPEHSTLNMTLLVRLALEFLWQTDLCTAFFRLVNSDPHLIYAET